MAKTAHCLGAYGRALADNGNFSQALDVLQRAHTPDQPDWRILSVQARLLDQMGRHADGAALLCQCARLMPDEPSVLSNLGLSYALSKNLPQAESTLRRAAAQPRVDPKVRQNLALVVGLQGRFQEAETIARGDLSQTEAAANVAYLRQMLAQQNEWKRTSAPRRSRRPPARSRYFKPGRHLFGLETGALVDERSCVAITRMAAGPRMTMNSTGKKEQDHRHGELRRQRRRAFFSASDIRISRFLRHHAQRLARAGCP